MTDNEGAGRSLGTMFTSVPVCSRALGTHWAQCLLVLVQLHWSPTTGHNGWKLELLIRGRILVY